ncbi:hypothetical protein GCM10011316_39070 [Roseibium aquae]|uniref:Uncharacterized protein n=1 Tax=Roseibium aquae TaxID=1323746 RepID=A0A916TP21_9HYPH|nr:hypothetical protein [Roseibium aquae]GGB63403.1 hypothetical protein GCM10011316_39070 [Roseibium aquae]
MKRVAGIVGAVMLGFVALVAVPLVVDRASPLDAEAMRTARIEPFGSVEVPAQMDGPTIPFAGARSYGPPEARVEVLGYVDDGNSEGWTSLKPGPFVDYYFEREVGQVFMGGFRIAPSMLVVRLGRGESALEPEDHARAAASLGKDPQWPNAGRRETAGRPDFTSGWRTRPDGVEVARVAYKRDDARDPTAWVARQGPHVVVLLDAMGTPEDVGARIVLDAVSSIDPGAGLEAYFAELDRAEAVSMERVAGMRAALRQALERLGGPAADAALPGVSGRWVLREWTNEGAPDIPLMSVGYRAGTVVRTADAEADAEAWFALRQMLIDRFDIYPVGIRRDETGMPRVYELEALPPDNLGPPGLYGAAPAIIDAAPPPPGRTDLWLSWTTNLRWDRAYDPARIQHAAEALAREAAPSGVYDAAGE